MLGNFCFVLKSVLCLHDKLKDMKRELRNLMKSFFKLKTINYISIHKEITPDGRWIKFEINFLVRNKIKKQ